MKINTNQRLRLPVPPMMETRRLNPAHRRPQLEHPLFTRSYWRSAGFWALCCSYCATVLVQSLRGVDAVSVQQHFEVGEVTCS